jgi:hypothetical protein
MTSSIRLAVGRWSDGHDHLIESVTKLLRNLNVEVEAGHQCEVTLNLAVGIDTNMSTAERETERRVDEDLSGDEINGQNPALGEIDRQVAHGYGLSQDYVNRLYTHNLSSKLKAVSAGE